MGAVADITEYVKPKLEEAEKRGMEKGKAERSQEVALGLLREGISLEVVSKTTGLSVKEINKLR